MNFKNKTFAVITHVYATGPAFKLEEYLLDKKVKEILFIGHPFNYTKDRKSFFRIHRNGKLIEERKFFQWNGPEISFYIKDVLLTFFWLATYKNKIDYYIAADNLNAFSGFLLRMVGKVDKVIFYTIDYVPNRSGNKLLNSLYHFLDRFAVRNSHRVWNLSSRMVFEREKRGVSSEYREKQITVPIGADVSPRSNILNSADYYKIVYMGHLLKKQGVEKLIDSMQDIRKSINQAHLLIIGGGPLEESLRIKVKKLKLEKNVAFTGFLKSFSEVQKNLKDAVVGVAPYVNDESTYTRYTDPGKPKDYLANGLAVVITKVPEVAFEIERRKCGVAINDNKKELTRAVVKLLGNKRLLQQYRKNAITMAKLYTWKKVFDSAFSETL